MAIPDMQDLNDMTREKEMSDKPVKCEGGDDRNSENCGATEEGYGEKDDQ